MPQSCILRCAVQPVHFYVRMLWWQKKGSILFSNLKIKFDISKMKSETESFKCIHFWLTFPNYQFYVCYQSHFLIQLLYEMGQHSREKVNKNSQLQPVLSVLGAPDSQKLTAYVLFHMLLYKYDSSTSSFFFFSYTTRINFSTSNYTAVKE